MNQIPQNQLPVEPIAEYQPTRLGRRTVLSLMTGIGLAAGGVVALPGSVTARMRQMDATPEAPVQDMEPAPATPELGEQPDGTVTWRVQAGHMDMEIGIEAMGFFPEAITINVGDRIFYDVHGFHTVTFLGEEEHLPFHVSEAQALGTPAPAGDVGSRWVLNPVAAFPSGPPVHAGTGFVNSGIPDPTVPPFVLEFTEPGTFEYLCLVHPKYMKARVVVQEQGTDRPLDQDAYDQQAAEQMDAILEQGRSLIEQHSVAQQATPAAGDGTVWDVVAGVGQEHAQVLRFLPDRLDIRAGDTVRWTNLAGPEPHTVTFPGDSPPPEFILVEPQPAGPPHLIYNPEIMEPAGDSPYGGTSYANSGWLLEEIAGGFPEGVEFPHTWELAFDTPGEYTYYCALHAGPGGEDSPELMGMVGTIVVS